MESDRRRRPPWFRGTWHPLSLAAVLLVPSAAVFGRPFWALPGNHEMLAWGLGVAYLAAALALSGVRRLRGRSTLPVRGAIVLAALSALYLAFLLRPDPEYSRPLLVLGSVLVAAGVLGPALLRVSGRLLLGAPAVLCAAAAGLLLAGNWEERVREVKLEATSEPASETRFLQSNRHALAVTTYTGVLPPPRKPRVSGGAIRRVPDSDAYLLARARGDLFWLSFGDDGDLRARELETRVPINNGAFEEDVGPRVNVKWFRVADVLVRRDGDRLRVLATHHFWRREEGCFVVRLAATTLPADPAEAAGGPGTAAWETVHDTEPCLPIREEGGGTPFGGLQVGGKMARLGEDRVLVTVGDHKFDGRGDGPVLPQDPDADYGKTLLVDFSADTAERFSLGHRNPQGLVVDGRGRIWETEHGPDGGDELNLLHREANYGWPYHTYGTAYDDVTWSLADPERLAQHSPPVWAWVPSIGVSSLIALDGSVFERWRGNLLAASLAGKSLWRMVLDGDRVAFAEPIEIGERIRDLEAGPEEVVLLTDWGRIVRLRPAGAAGEGAAVYQRLCGGCHRLGPDGGHAIGPNLRGIVGREVASAPDYDYSPALLRMEGAWTEERLDRFLADPAGLAPGTSMEFEGLEDAETRRAVVEHLRTVH